MARPNRLIETLLALVLLTAGATFSVCATQAPAPRNAWLLTLHDAVGPATADYLIRNLQRAQSAQAPLVIIVIDTPGGLDQSMRDINQAILDSPVPVACLVAPEGARAASAGTYILYACHVAAMARATHLGAATPVAIGAPSGAPDKPIDDKGENGKAPDKGAQRDAMHDKAVNDAAAYIRTLAQWRGRNADWAELAVREAATMTAQEALAANVIDLIADSPADLLRQLDGRRIAVHGKTPVVLDTEGLALHSVPPDWRNRFLAVITNPNVAYVLMLIGIYGLVLEFYSPGAILPGTLGGICLLLALYAFQVLPVNYSGLALLLLGLALMIAEAMIASFGILGISGVVAFVMGSILLLDTEVPGFRIALSLIFAFAAVSVALLIVLVGMALRTRRRKPVSGIETWVGERAEAVASFDAEGKVLIHGELWDAWTSRPVQRGQWLTVTAVDGLHLRVAPETPEERIS